MSVLDQNSALASVYRDLLPGPGLIDGRTQRDMVSFIAAFGRLINFFEGAHKRHGNWQPFMLKDPVFLLATISRCRFTNYYDPYVDGCKVLDAGFAPQVSGVTEPAIDISVHLNLTFDHVFRVFKVLAHWTRYMMMPDHDYDLRNYTVTQIKNKFAPMFWAFVSLKDAIGATTKVKGILPVDRQSLAYFDDHLWKERKGSMPFLEILDDYYEPQEGAIPVINDNTGELRKFYNAIKKVGDSIFTFFRAVIENADKEYEYVCSKKSPFPDTLLLRTFIDALTIQRDQLNDISARHLAFYYNTILKQKPAAAVPDKVFLCIGSGKKDATVTLPQGTLFNGGLTADKTPILFSSNDTISVNPGSVTMAYTLCREQITYKTNNGNSTIERLILSKHNADAAQPDANGALTGWGSFGSGLMYAPATEVVTSFIVATPMLLLRGGARTVKLTPKFDKDLKDALPLVTIYVSTAQAWLKIPGVYSLGSEKKMEFSLSPDQPPVAPFPKNEEGISSPWPLLKIEFSKVPDWSAPPVLKQLDIDVTVSNLQTSVLYNDYGPLGNKPPYQFLGPTPLPGAAFIFGNDEVFSKPVKKMIVTFTWGTLPVGGFGNYYSIYNRYLTETGEIPNTNYNDTDSFTAQFATLNNGEWENLQSNDIPPAILFIPDPQGTPDKNFYINTTTYCFKANADRPLFPIAPDLQTKPYIYSVQSTNGFFKLSLAGNPWGFGSTLYPKVLTYITIQNAAAIAKGEQNGNGASDTKSNSGRFVRAWNGVKRFVKNTIVRRKIAVVSTIAPKGIPFKIMPNVPFVPMLNSFDIECYNATATFAFYSKNCTSPIQCYYATPFKNELIFDSTSSQTISDTGIVPGPAVNTPSNGLHLFSPIGHPGYMLLEIDGLVAPCGLSLYFELAAAQQACDNTNACIYCYYLAGDTWKPLTITSDGTLAFTCSGILKLDVPTDVAPATWMGVNNKCWLAIGVTGTPCAYSKVTFLGMNGVTATRTIDSLPGSNDPLNITAGSITKTQASVPGIVSVLQPFSSFGGKRGETMQQMNRSVSQRLLTKDRVMTSVDHYRLLMLEFSNLYHVTTGYDTTTGNTMIWVIQRCADVRNANAFWPQLTPCMSIAIELYLKGKISVFTQLKVTGFSLSKVSVSAQISVKTGYSFASVRTAVENMLNLYLSPWITSEQAQLPVGKPLTVAGLALAIKKVEGVDDVQDISFGSTAADINKGQILVSSLTHAITPKKGNK